MDKSSLFGLMILACCLTVTLCAPQSKDSQDNDYQGDDYDYNDEDQNGSSQQGTTAITTKHAQPYFPNSKETVAGIIGKEVTLKCDAQNLQADNVIVWYKGDQAVLTKNLFTPNYKLVQNDMVILNATEESQGDYYCHVLPQKIRKHLHVIMGDHPMEAIVPESSTSGSAATYSSALCLAVILSSLRLFQR